MVYAFDMVLCMSCMGSMNALKSAYTTKGTLMNLLMFLNFRRSASDPSFGFG